MSDENSIIADEISDELTEMQTTPAQRPVLPSFNLCKLHNCAIAIVGRCQPDCAKVASKMLRKWRSFIRQTNIVSASVLTRLQYAFVSGNLHYHIRTPMHVVSSRVIISSENALVIDECCHPYMLEEAAIQLLERHHRNQTGWIITIPSHVTNLSKVVSHLQYCFILRETVHKQLLNTWKLFGSHISFIEFQEFHDIATRGGCLVVDLKTRKFYQMHM